MDFVNAVRRGQTDLDEWLTRKEAERGRVSLREVVNSLLSGLLQPAHDNDASIIRGVNLALERRDATLHRGEPVCKEQAQEALEAAQQLLFATDSFWRQLGA